MIKTTYDPIMGVRYICIEEKGLTEAKRATIIKAREQFNRKRHVLRKQARRNNTKIK